MLDVLLADIQPLTAAGLVHFIESKDDLRIVDHVLERGQLGNLLKRHLPNLLIADYNIPGYLTIDDLKTVREISPATNILIISSDSNKPTILEVIQLGIMGYLTKECSREEVLMAVQSAGRGEKFFCHKILEIIMEQRFSPVQQSPDSALLTARETEILVLIAKGKSTQVIADELYLSPHTVQTHRKSIIRKLNIKSPTEFVIYALDFGLIKPK